MWAGAQGGLCGFLMGTWGGSANSGGGKEHLPRHGVAVGPEAEALGGDTAFETYSWIDITAWGCWQPMPYLLVMANFMCQCNWATWSPDIWLKSFWAHLCRCFWMKLMLEPVD
jgi:hypothetical protein